jgi:hypothetical protein
VLDLWSKKLDFFLKKDISNFISTIRLWIDIIFEIWKLIPEQERLSNKKSINRVCKILDRSDINTSPHFLQNWAAGGNAVDPKKEKQAIFRSARGK